MKWTYDEDGLLPCTGYAGVWCGGMISVYVSLETLDVKMFETPDMEQPHQAHMREILCLKCLKHSSVIHALFSDFVSPSPPLPSSLYIFFLGFSSPLPPWPFISSSSLSLSCSSLPFLCMAGLIEYLNKLINHGRPAKTDRSREVMFIKLPPPHPPTHFVSLIPTCSLFCWMCTFTPPLLPSHTPSPQIPLPQPRLYPYTQSFTIYDFA